MIHGTQHTKEAPCLSFSYLAGTSRPTKYAVLLDENNFSADELQQFTYHTCYTYVRSTRAVSMAPAAYYAHLLAARARCFIDDGTSGHDTGASEQRATNTAVIPPPLGSPSSQFSHDTKTRTYLPSQARDNNHKKNTRHANSVFRFPFETLGACLRFASGRRVVAWPVVCGSI